jgi:DNA-binding transcriptional regulator YiaG
LVGVSGLTIYNWEHGKSRPARNDFAALVSVRQMGERGALAKLGLLK